MWLDFLDLWLRVPSFGIRVRFFEGPLRDP
jgi:hypothetical protein